MVEKCKGGRSLWAQPRTHSVVHSTGGHTEGLMGLTASMEAGDGVRGGVGTGGSISAGFVHCVFPVAVLW